MKKDSTAKFSDQYKHPKWQKKRLEVLEHDNYTCTKCGDSDSELHVHHVFYVKGNKVWEYDTPELVTLCKSCHSEIHDSKDCFTEFIMPHLSNNVRLDGEFDIFDMYRLIDAVICSSDIYKNVCLVLSKQCEVEANLEKLLIKKWEQDNG